MTHNAATPARKASTSRPSPHRRTLMVVGLLLVAAAIIAQAAISLSGVLIFNGATVLVIVGVVVGGLMFGAGRGDA